MTDLKIGLSGVFLVRSSELHHFMLLPDLVHELQFDASKMTVKHGNRYPGQKTGAFSGKMLI